MAERSADGADAPLWTASAASGVADLAETHGGSAGIACVASASTEASGWLVGADRWPRGPGAARVSAETTSAAADTDFRSFSGPVRSPPSAPTARGRRGWPLVGDRHVRAPDGRVRHRRHRARLVAGRPVVRPVSWMPQRLGPRVCCGGPSQRLGKGGRLHRSMDGRRAPARGIRASAADARLRDGRRRDFPRNTWDHGFASSSPTAVPSACSTRRRSAALSSGKGATSAGPLAVSADASRSEGTRSTSRAVSRAASRTAASCSSSTSRATVCNVASAAAARSLAASTAAA
jgi:hypothetical protein